MKEKKKDHEIKEKISRQKYYEEKKSNVLDLDLFLLFCPSASKSFCSVLIQCIVKTNTDTNDSDITCFNDETDTEKYIHSAQGHNFITNHCVSHCIR